MRPAAAQEFAGAGLIEICETLGTPSVLHMGSCVGNSCLLIAVSQMVTEGGLGEHISDLPVAGTSPIWMSEKAVAIGQYFVASGLYVIFNSLPVTDSKKATKCLLEGHKKLFEYWKEVMWYGEFDELCSQALFTVRGGNLINCESLGGMSVRICCH